MNNIDFWPWFDSQAAPFLQNREPSFRKIFEELDQIPAPITIVETGCVRQENNWGGDGMSTVLFDRYVSFRGGHVWTVDIDPDSVELCRALVSDHVTVTEADSVKFLHALAKDFLQNNRRIDLCYLDSFDLDWQNNLPSALHHLKELSAIRPALNPDTLIVVDDSPSGTDIETNIPNRLVVGKGQMVADYANHLGIQPHFLHYQVAWKGL